MAQSVQALQDRVVVKMLSQKDAGLTVVEKASKPKAKAKAGVEQEGRCQVGEVVSEGGFYRGNAGSLVASKPLGAGTRVLFSTSACCTFEQGGEKLTIVSVDDILAIVPKPAPVVQPVPAPVPAVKPAEVKPPGAK